MRKFLLFFAIGILFLSATRSNAEVTFTYNGGNLTISQTVAGEIEGAFAPDPKGPDILPDGCTDYTQEQWAALTDPQRKAWFDNQVDITEAPATFDYSSYWANYKNNDYNQKWTWLTTTYASTAPSIYDKSQYDNKEWTELEGYQREDVLRRYMSDNTLVPDAFGWNDLTDDQKKEVKSGWNQYVADRAAEGAAARQEIIDAFNAAVGSVTDLDQVTFSGNFKKPDIDKLTTENPFKDIVKSAEKVDMANTTFSNYNDMDFKPWGSTLTEAVTSLNAPDDYTVGPNNFNNSNTNLATITYNSGIVGKPFDNNNVTTVNIGPNTVAVADNAFLRGNVSTLNMDNATSLATIGNSAFLACPITGTLTIGTAVVQIKESAFEEVPITTLIIPSDNHVIESIGGRAFLQNGGGNLKNVYVNTHRLIQCHVDAFSLDNVDGQTQIEAAGARTRLYYPIEYYDWYVGLYKHNINNGNLVTQSNLIDNRNQATNGWQRFVSSGILMAPGTTWRTYSDVVPLIVPKTDTNVEVFLVHGYDVDADATILVKMDQDDYIPTGTGILVHFPEVDSSKGSVLYFQPAMRKSGNKITTPDGGEIDEWVFIPEAYNMEPYENQYHKSNKYKGEYDNYLVALNVSSLAAPVQIDNVEIVNGKKTYRNYFFGPLKSLPQPDSNGRVWVDEAQWAKWVKEDHKALNWGFVRSKTGGYRVSQKAYLHFPVGANFPGKTSGSIAAQVDGEQILAKDLSVTFINREEFDINNYTNPFADEEATSIDGVAETSKCDNTFYTLQGVKVSSPAKNGIYIYNGKKYIVK